jgi:DNA-binding beta-propeller fold protein YncE
MSVLGNLGHWQVLRGVRRIGRTSMGLALLAALAMGGGAGRARLVAAAPGMRWQTVLTAPAVQAPTGLAIDLRGRPAASKWAYVADAATRRIVKFGTGGTVLKSWWYGEPSTYSAMPASIAVGGKGNVFVADPATGTITKFSPAGVLLRRWRGFGALGGIAVDAAGNIYVARADGYAVDELNAGGGYVSTTDTHLVWGGGSVGKPFAVALDPPDHRWYLAARCTVGIDCGPSVGVSPSFERRDGLLELAGGKVQQVWFGLGHTASGKAQEGPAKEAEPFVTIDAMVNDARGNLYLAGNLWPLGGKQGYGIVEYTPLGGKVAYWPLPAQSPVAGIAVDGRKTIYVSQGGRVLKLERYP